MQRDREITLMPHLGLATAIGAFHLRFVSPPNVVPPKPRSSLFGGAWAVLSLSPERTAFFFASMLGRRSMAPLLLDVPYLEVVGLACRRGARRVFDHLS